MNIEEQIRRAMEEGQFDNLPGKGKPLKKDDNAVGDPEWRMAHKILKDSGFTLPWIERRREIDESLEKARASLLRAWIWRQDNLVSKKSYDNVEVEWQRSETVFREQVLVLNKQIFIYNLEAPSPQFQCLAIDVEREIDAIKKVLG